MNIEEVNGKKKNSTAQAVQLAVVVLVLVVLAYFVIKFVMGFIWWIVSILAIAVLAINYKLLIKIVNYIRGLYGKNVYLGGAATLGSLLVFTPFVGVLFLKTIWDFRDSDFLPFGKKKGAQDNKTLDINYVDVSNKDNNLLQ